ncbi:hypothetical protein [uncultured Desulfobacter sp.]|uniref:hypothetical protein n=1 Tax=uncultured Desulfobacter sp. TaxID=240139 RepID=UPI002AAAC852|nr:hypothetical protein [uncultured Desulfobacter sp.]
MDDYGKLKNRIEAVVRECESLMNYFDMLLQDSQKGKFAQLQEIEKTIDSMQQKGIDIPPELRKLKLDFLSGLDDVEKQKALKRELIENIQRIFPGQTRNLSKKKKDEMTPNRKPRLPKQFPPDGTLCRFAYKEQLYKAEIQDNQIVVDNYGAFPSFSAASVKISQTSRNGWRDWELWIPELQRWILADIWRKMTK